MKKNLLVVLALVFAMISCSKDDGGDNPIVEEGGEVFTSQVVTISLPETELTENQYQGTFGGVPVSLIKGPDNTLLFLVPSDVLGNGDLVIPSLNITVHYNSQQTVLTGSAQQVMESFMTNMETFKQTLDDSPEAASVRHTLQSFETYFSSADDAEKIQIATIYQANKSKFDQLILANYTVEGRHIVAETRIFIEKHKVAIAALGVGCALVGSAPVIGIPLMAVGAYKAYKANEAAIENVYSTLTLKVSGWFGNNDRGIAADGLVVSHDVAKTFPFSLSERKMIQGDASKTEPLAVDYFTSHELYNFYASTTNATIDATNTAKSTDYNDIPLEQLAASNPSVLTAVNDDIFENITFSVNHPNLVLESAEMAGDGQLKVKVKITGSPATLPIETTLNYEYDDDFSTFSGTLPLTVELSIEGSWTALEIEGVAIGQWINVYSPGCPQVVILQDKWLNRTLTFTENTYSFTGDVITRNLNKVVQNDCTVLVDNPDTEQQDADEEGGNYLFEGTTLTINPGTEDEVTGTVQFITADKIKIDTDIYQRQ